MVKYGIIFLNYLIHLKFNIMKKTIIFFACAFTAVLGFSQTVNNLFFTLKYPNSYAVYNTTNGLVATTSNSETGLLAALFASKNTSVTLNNSKDSLVFHGSLIGLPFGHEIISVTDSSILVAGSDTLWQYLTTTQQWSVIATGIGNDLPASVDHVLLGDTIIVVTLDSSGPNKFVSCSSLNYSTGLFGEYSVGDSAQDVFFLKGDISYGINSQEVVLGSITAPISKVSLVDLNPLETCIPHWCFNIPLGFFNEEQNLSYLLDPYDKYLDETVDTNYLYHLNLGTKLMATDRVSGSFSVSIDCPVWNGPVDNSFFKINQYLDLKKKNEGVLIHAKEQRFFARRVTFPSYGFLGFIGSFSVGKTWMEDGNIKSLDAVWNNQCVNIFDSLGAFIEKYYIFETHDGADVDSYSVTTMSYIDPATIWRYDPPVVLKKGTTTKVASINLPAQFDQMPPKVIDSCLLASSLGLPSNIVDAQHVNSVDMFKVPFLGVYVLIVSYRNVGMWPLSWPLVAWRFNPVTETLTLDTGLIKAVNSSSFGFGREGGHAWKIEKTLSDPANNKWVMVQYDNQSCSNGLSYAHSVALSIDSTGWVLDDFRKFSAANSSAMGNASVYRNFTDTLISINTGSAYQGSNGNWFSFEEQPSTIIKDFSTGAHLCSIDWGSNALGNRASVYQCNATGEKFSQPEFAISVIEDGDSLRITADTIPGIGKWFWWLGNKPANVPLVISKYDLIATEGVVSYISGWFTEGDTIPGNALNAPRSRWISNPIWVPALISGLDNFKVLDNIKIFPNPTVDKVSVEGVMLAKTTTIITDITGKQCPVIIENNTLNIDVYTPGIYFLSIQYGDRTITKKIIKL